MNKNIILVGFMGTGKTTVGKLLAEQLGRELVDMDAVIESREGRSISDIFAKEGEAHFRELERALVKELAGRDALVITPGGGIVLNPENIADFERTGDVVCLQATPEAILERVAHETHRPLLQEGDKLTKIRDILAKRQPLYDAVSRQVDTSGQTAEQVAQKVLELCQ